MSVPTPNDDLPGLRWPICRVREDGLEQLDDLVPLEEPLEIVLNGKPIAVLMRLPGQEKELAAGFCISEGYVRGMQDILLIHHCGLGHPVPSETEPETGRLSRNRVEVHADAAGLIAGERAEATRLIRSGCAAADVSAMGESLPLLTSTWTVTASMVLRLGQAMRERQNVHRQVGGTHSAAIFRPDGTLVALAEDIGRHNAVDKVLGYSLLRGLSLDDKLLLTSGRASYEMITKALRLHIPVIVSMSAPTSLAVQLAQDRGLTLIGYLRGGRMNVYTHTQRLVLDLTN